MARPRTNQDRTSTHVASFEHNGEVWDAYGIEGDRQVTYFESGNRTVWFGRNLHEFVELLIEMHFHLDTTTRTIFKHNSNGEWTPCVVEGSLPEGSRAPTQWNDRILAAL